MKTLISGISSLLAIFGICTQALIAWAWIRTDAAEQFVRFFVEFYGFVPAWSSFVFGAKAYAWLWPVLFAALLFYGLVSRKPTRFIVSVAGATLVVTGALVYAMYPLHHMLKVAI